MSVLRLWRISRVGTFAPVGQDEPIGSVVYDNVFLECKSCFEGNGKTLESLKCTYEVEQGQVLTGVCLSKPGLL